MLPASYCRRTTSLHQHCPTFWPQQDITCLLHQMSRNFCLVFPILCFPNTRGLRHTVPSNNLTYLHSQPHEQGDTSVLVTSYICILLGQSGVQKGDSRKHAERYQISELGTLFAPSPHLADFRKNKEQAVDGIKSCDRAELCLWKLLHFLQYILWQFIGTPYWIHAFRMATIIVTNLYFFFIST